MALESLFDLKLWHSMYSRPVENTKNGEQQFVDFGSWYHFAIMPQAGTISDWKM